MSPRQEQLRQRIEGLLGRMFLNMRPQFAELQPIRKLTMPQLRALLLLRALGPLRMSDLASRLGVGLPTATSLVSKLEEKGLAAREHASQDRRVVLCSASERGRREAARFWRVKRERLAQITDALSAAELDLVARALEAVVRAAQRCPAAEGSPAPKPGAAAATPRRR